MKNLSISIQRFGRTLLLPIGVMAPIGFILGVSGAFAQSYMIELLPFLGNPIVNGFFVSLRSIADQVFKNVPLLFAMGVAYGVTKKDKGISVFSAVISYIVLLATMNVVLKLTGQLATDNLAGSGQEMMLGIQTLAISALGGIISGLIAAWVNDRFIETELPVAFAFFGGKKAVPIVTIGLTVAVGIVIPFIWQFLVKGIIAMSSVLLSDYLGTFLYTAIYRSMIPFGLHYVWSSLLRFTEAGGTYVINGETYVGVVNAMNQIIFNLGPTSEYWKLMPSLTRYMAQNQMINTLFMLPAAGFAMYKTAYTENKTIAKSLILAACLTAFFGNVTEPMEFTFAFIAPVLFLFYVVVSGLAAVAMYVMGTAVGYIRGTIFDFGIFGLLYENSHWINIVIVGSVTAVLTYFVFKWYILKYDIKTPGREEGASNNILLKEKRYDEIARLVVKGLGGKDNLVLVENCITRLRVDLKSMELVDKKILDEAGSTGIFFPVKNHIHVVFGPQVEFVKNAVDRELHA